MEKFYSVMYWPEGNSKPTILQNHCKDSDAACRVAKKGAVDHGCPVYIMTSTALVQSPTPEATVTVIQ